MPEKGIGKALRSAISGQRQEETKPKGEALLLNVHRRAILEFLCRKPCATPSLVARALDLSPNAVAWHFQKLLDGGYLGRAGTEAAYPAGLLPATDVGIFLLLMQERVRSVLVATLEHPGASQDAIAETSGVSRQTAARGLEELERAGLVNVVRDGRTNRYYMTPLLATRRDANAKRALAFSDGVLKMLQAEGLRPQVLRRNSEEILLRLGGGAQAPVLHLRTDPYQTLLA